jgi:hypothetical protein
VCVLERERERESDAMKRVHSPGATANDDEVDQLIAEARENLSYFSSDDDAGVFPPRVHAWNLVVMTCIYMCVVCHTVCAYACLFVLCQCDQHTHKHTHTHTHTLHYTTHLVTLTFTLPLNATHYPISAPVTRYRYDDVPLGLDAVDETRIFGTLDDETEGELFVVDVETLEDDELREDFVHVLGLEALHKCVISLFLSLSFSFSLVLFYTYVFVCLFGWLFGCLLCVVMDGIDRCCAMVGDGGVSVGCCCCMLTFSLSLSLFFFFFFLFLFRTHNTISPPPLLHDSLPWWDLSLQGKVDVAFVLACRDGDIARARLLLETGVRVRLVDAERHLEREESAGEDEHRLQGLKGMCVYACMCRHMSIYVSIYVCMCELSLANIFSLSVCLSICLSICLSCVVAQQTRLPWPMPNPVPNPPTNALCVRYSHL